MASKKLQSALANDEIECVLDMSPMIDMVFLLLIFFIVNATAVKVRTDPKVKLAVAAESQRVEDSTGYIVINVRADGSYSAENPEQTLANSEAILLYLQSKKKGLSTGITPKLNLHGDRLAVFKHSRELVRLAAQEGIDQVVFAVTQNSK